jgi:WD40 repeat protein
MHERQPATTIDLASNAITALALGPDGASVALNAESELSVWPDVISNRNAQSFQLDPGAAPVTAIGFTPDGRQIVSGSQDGTVLLWDSRRGAAASDGSQWDVVQRACIVAGRDLTPAEWTEHLGDEPYRETCPVP